MTDIALHNGSKADLVKRMRNIKLDAPKADLFLVLGKSLDPEAWTRMPHELTGTPIISGRDRDAYRCAGYCGTHLIVVAVNPDDIDNRVWGALESSLAHTPQSKLVNWVLS